MIQLDEIKFEIMVEWSNLKDNNWNVEHKKNTWLVPN